MTLQKSFQSCAWWSRIEACAGVRAQVSMATRFWAVGMAEPQPLEALRELHWLVSLGAGANPPACLGMAHWRHHCECMLL